MDNNVAKVINHGDKLVMAKEFVLDEQDTRASV